MGSLSHAAGPRDPSGAPCALAVLPLGQPFCLCPFPQSLPVETLGPESRRDPEPESAPHTPQSPSKAAAEELAGTLDGEGNRALLGGGAATSPPCSGVSQFPWGEGGWSVLFPALMSAEDLPPSSHPGFVLPLPTRTGPVGGRGPRGVFSWGLWYFS